MLANDGPQRVARWPILLTVPLGAVLGGLIIAIARAIWVGPCCRNIGPILHREFADAAEWAGSGTLIVIHWFELAALVLLWPYLWFVLRC